MASSGLHHRPADVVGRVGRAQTRSYVTEGDRTDVVLLEHWTVFATGRSYFVHTVNSWRVNGQGKLMGFINYPDVDEVAAAYVP